MGIGLFQGFNGDRADLRSDIQVIINDEAPCLDPRQSTVTPATDQ